MACLRPKLSNVYRYSLLIVLSHVRCLFDDSYPNDPTWDVPRWQLSLALLVHRFLHPRRLSEASVKHPRVVLFRQDLATTETSIRAPKRLFVAASGSGMMGAKRNPVRGIMDNDGLLLMSRRGSASALIMLAIMMPSSECRRLQTADLRYKRE